MSLPVLYRLTGAVSPLVPARVVRASRRLPLLQTAITRLLDRSAPAGSVEVVSVAGPARGMRLILDLKAEREYWLGTYERQLIRTAKDVCRPGMTVYDVGANIGYTSLVFARLAGSRGSVFAFEPLPELVQRLAGHIRLNAFESRITLVSYAVSDCEGQEQFLVHQSHAMGKLAGSGTRDTIYGHEIDVQSMRLDDFVFRDQHPAPDVLKLDIEGGGVKAIPGMRRVLEQHRPTLMLELHGDEEKQVVWDTLQPLGYRFHWMQLGYPAIDQLADLMPRWRQHALAVPALKSPGLLKSDAS